MARTAILRVVLLVCLLAGGLAVAPFGARAQEAASGDGTYVINLRATELTAFAEQVSEITGRTLVLDPQVQGEVTVVSAEPLDADGVWALFQSILKVRGFLAVRSGVVWEVIPEADAVTRSGPIASDQTSSQDLVTQIVRLERLPSAEVVRVLGPLIDESGYIEALTDPNAVVITDLRANVDRVAAIARAFDADTQMDSVVIRFRFAEAVSVGRAITELLGPAGTGARISVDPGSNLLLVRGSDADIQQIRLLASALDIAPRTSPAEEVGTRVFKLQYGDAEVVAEIIRNTLQGGTDLTNPVAEAIGEAPAEGDAAATGPAAPAPVAAVSVQASSETNAVIARGTARQLAEVSSLVQSLDVRRAQVMIEAAIVEVSGDVAERLGVQLGLDRAAPPGGLAATSFSNAGPSLQNILLALGQSSAAALSTGLTIGASNDDFGVLVQALSQSTNANLLSTPSITTMDNQPATIVVGQNVPFRTGAFATDGNTVQPFTTIERRDVGITMEVLPRVTSGGVVRLEIAQEVSSLVDTNVQGAADLVTNRRVINTTILADDRGTVVLGGLITDDETSNTSKVPLLGDVPVVGNLFKSRQKNATRRTLFVFLRPTILRNQHEAQSTAQRQYQRVRRADAADPPGPLRRTPAVRKLPLEINGLY